MISAIIASLDANLIVPLLAVAAYAVYREVGAVAAAAFGQYFVNASSLSRAYVMDGTDHGCLPLVISLALLPLLVFAFVTSAYSETVRSQERTSNASDVLLFLAMLSAAISANHCMLALTNVPLAAGSAWSASLIAGLFAGAAITLRRLGGASLTTVDQSIVISPADAGNALREVLAGASYSTAAVEPASDATPIDDEAPTNIARPLQRTRPEAVSSTSYLFNRNEFYIFRHGHLKDLEDLLRREPPGVLEGLHAAISYRLGRTPIAGDQRAFVRAYVSQFRKRIEVSYPEYFAPERLELLAA